MNIIPLDEQFTLAINSLNSPFFDVLMYWISDRFIWIPFYALLIYVLFRQYGKQTWIKLLFVALLILWVDQTCNLFKNVVFMRLRPCHNPELAPLLHLVKGKCGGLYGFISGHAANSFALATFLVFQMRQKYSWIGWLFLWAAIIAYSRIYLGVHYFGDVIFGALWGSFVGYLVYQLEFFLTNYFFQKKLRNK
jgi:undecaprenyl-diphosphatase